MGLVSIAAGIFLGVFCSQFITALLLTSYGKQYEITWMLFPDTVALTAAFFMLSFLVVGLSNTRAIRKMKIIDMLTADRENGPELRKSRWIWVLTVLFEVFSLWMCVTGVQKVIFYWDSRFALPVQLMFWGNILFPVLSLLWPVLWVLRRRRGGTLDAPPRTFALRPAEYHCSSQRAGIEQPVSSGTGRRGRQSISALRFSGSHFHDLCPALSRQQRSCCVEGGGAGAPL